MMRAWGVQPQDFRLALTASLFGILFGAPALGHAG